MADEDWSFPFEGTLHEAFPALHEAQSAWLAQIDSLPVPDRKTHKLIRLVCTVILRNPEGIERHAMLAADGGNLGRGAGGDDADHARLRGPARGRGHPRRFAAASSPPGPPEID